MRGLTWLQIKNLLAFAQIRLKEGRLPQVAGSLTFTTVLALVPILTIALAIFTAFPLFNSFRTSLEAYFIQSLMPKGISNTILGYLTQFATKATRLSAVGGVAFIVTAVTTMAMIDRSFNQIWHVKRSRSMFQSLLVYWAIVTLGPLLIGVSITITSYLFTATSDVVGATPFIGSVFYTLVSLLFTTMAFSFLYLAVPNRKIAWYDATWGGVFAALAFELAKRLFAVFVVKFPSYTVVYGALAAVPIFLVWIYLSWMITLMGAVIAASLPIIKYERWRHVPTPGSEFLDAVEVMRILNAARASANPIVDVASIRAQTRFGYDEIDGLLEKMLEQGWVARILTDSTDQSKSSSVWRKLDIGAERWICSFNPASLRLSEVYKVFVFNVQSQGSLAVFTGQIIDQGLDVSLEQYFLK